MALFGPNIIAGQDPASAYGLPGSAAPAVPTSPFSGGGFASMLNSLSGAGGMSDINNGLQSLAYGIGSFAKDPRKRAMYIQAAQEHQKAMSADKREHLKALDERSNQLLEIIAAHPGDPQVMNAISPLLETHVNALNHFSQGAGDELRQRADAYNKLPAPQQELVPVPGPDGKPVYGQKVAGAGVYEKPDSVSSPAAVQEYEYAVKQGFKGTLEQFLLAQKQAGASSVKINMPNQDEYNSRLYSARMQQANSDLESVLASGWKPGMVEGAVAGLPGGNMLASENRQLFNQARDNFINATLRRESGAAISADEYVKADKQYFPQPNDGAKVLAQKARNRALAITGIAQAGGRAPQLAIPAGGAPAAAPPAAATNQPAGGAKMPPPPPGAVLLGQ